MTRPGSSAPASAAEDGDVPGDAGGGSGARRAAWRVLRDVDSGAHAGRSARRRFASLSPRDRRLATEMAYGVVRLRARLDHELAGVVDRPLDRVEPGVMDWLRLGLYQLRELRVPDHAAVDESVQGARETVGGRVTGFVNGVLRAAARQGDRRGRFPSLEDDPVAHLATWGSHPEWLVRRWIDRWGVETTARLVERDNRPPEVTVRLLDRDLAAARTAAGGTGLEVEPLAAWPGCVVVDGGDPAALLERVPAVAQDPAASAVVDYVGPVPEGPVLDACAAPGGKALALAHGRDDGAPFVAADVSRERLELVRDAATRTGSGLRCLAMDARRPAVAEAELVLVDAPCSGTGTLRRRPDARWRADPGRLETLAALQREILDGCAGAVAPGGLLVYATCSLEPEENEDQVDAFLHRHPEFERAGPGDGGRLPAGVVDGSGDLRVLPWQRGTDGSYAARLRRRA